MQLLCPVCKEKLNIRNKSYVCDNLHCFDIAKEGYVNLLRANKSGENIGDNRDMAVSRRNFLSKGYYSVLAEKICEIVGEYSDGGTLLDICCGEGYYSSCFSENMKNHSVVGFDISKEMIKLAAKRKSEAEFFVANMTDIPLADESADVITHLFATFCAVEFNRILKKNGVLLSVVSGERHLYSLKEVLYEHPYLNDEAEPEATGFYLTDKIKTGTTIKLDNNEDIFSLLKMTPYYYHTPSAGLERLSQMKELETEIDFSIFVYKKN